MFLGGNIVVGIGLVFFISLCFIIIGQIAKSDSCNKPYVKSENSYSSFNETKLKELVKNFVREELKKSYEKNGYYSLSEDFVTKLDNKISNKYELDSDMLISYNLLKKDDKLLKIINNAINKCVLELKPIHKKVISYNENQIRENFIQEIFDSIFAENHNIPYLSLRCVDTESFDYKKEKVITYKDLIGDYSKNELKSAYLETKDDCQDLEEIINSYISEQNEIINSEDYKLEEAIYNAEEMLDNVENAREFVEDSLVIDIPLNVIPKSYELTDYFPIVKPLKFLNLNGSNYDYNLKVWTSLLKYEKYILNAKKILTYYIQKKKAIVKMKTYILEKVDTNKIKQFIFDKKNPSNIIIAMINTFLQNIDFPEYLHFSWDVNYDSESQIILIDLFIPTSDSFPCYKSCKRITKNTRKIEFNILSKKEKEDIYQDYIYSLVLNLIDAIFNFNIYIEDTNKYLNEHIKSIAVNGIVKFIDDSDGQPKESCILSILTTEKEFSKIDLSNVDYKKCFKRLKGLSSASLIENVAITPVISFNKEDKRFIEGKDVLNSLDASINIAAMDWQDFENLVRDIFEKEFCTDGSEVKITQSSHDGGVDAVVFDPDPIKGGKIVIQAKRYTNVVNVSAVRDLYGTVMNEGANKGILVTTSNFGADSHNFAKDKPITLINGNQLLYLLEKHNVKARIDIKEAKKILNLQSSSEV